MERGWIKNGDMFLVYVFFFLLFCTVFSLTLSGLDLTYEYS